MDELSLHEYITIFFGYSSAKNVEPDVEVWFMVNLVEIWCLWADRFTERILGYHVGGVWKRK